jgi:HopA1 effector protein family
MSRLESELPAELVDRLAPALAAFVIHSPLGFSFSDEPFDVVVMQIAPVGLQAVPVVPGTPEIERLVGAVQAVLYNRCYVRCFAEPDAPASPHAPDPDFLRRLTDANTSRDRWDKGWVIRHVARNGEVFAHKGDRERAAVPGTYIADTMLGMAPQVGMRISFRALRDSIEVQPGYYFAFGETLDELAERLSLVRFYFHCPAANAATLLGELTGAFNSYQVPFRFKLPAAPTHYGRTDAAVLYTGARYFSISARIISELRDKVFLEPTVPLFTKRLWTGIGVAADPGSGESFGMHRCRLTAEGIVEAWQNGRQGTASRLVAVAGRFAGAGLDLARPYLGPGGVDLFQVAEPAMMP